MKHYGTTGGRVPVPVISVVLLRHQLEGFGLFFFLCYIPLAPTGGREEGREIGSQVW